MKDQVDQLKSKGIRAEAIHSGMSYTQIDRILDNAVYGGLKLLYVSPNACVPTWPKPGSDK